MRNKQAAIGLTLALLVVLAGCGESGPKRAVDARTEVLHFFSTDAPLVGLVRLDRTGQLLALNRTTHGSPTWSTLRGLVQGPLHVAGLEGPQLSRLLQPQQEIEGIDAAALAIGAPTAASYAVDEPLLVLATDQPELLSRLLRRAASAGRLKPVGQLDEAALYRSPTASFAARDGVLVSAPGLAEVREAIERRDGDSDQQLDEDVVESLFNELDAQGGFLAYANLAALRDADTGLATLAAGQPWLESADLAAASARARNGVVQVDAIVKMSNSLDPSQLPFGTAPRQFEISLADVPRIVPRRSDPLHAALAGFAPLRGEGTATGDEVRLHVELAP